MANPVYVSGQVTIGTSPTAIAVPGTASQMLVSNSSGATVYLGGSSVSTSTGYAVAASATNVPVPVPGGQQATLYGVVASTTSVISYLFVV